MEDKFGLKGKLRLRLKVTPRAADVYLWEGDEVVYGEAARDWMGKTVKTV